MSKTKTSKEKPAIQGFTVSELSVAPGEKCWKIVCNTCDRAWRYPMGQVMKPGGFLRLLDHRASHDPLRKALDKLL